MPGGTPQGIKGFLAALLKLSYTLFIIINKTKSTTNDYTLFIPKGSTHIHRPADMFEAPSEVQRTKKIRILLGDRITTPAPGSLSSSSSTVSRASRSVLS